MTKRTKTEFIVVHCADTYADMDIGAKEIRKWHIEERGWSDIGYAHVIRRNGKIENGRSVYDVGAHVAGYNSISVGICMVGGKSRATGKGEQNFTPEQYTALKNLLETYKDLFPNAEVVGHRDLNAGKECPSFDVKHWYAGVLHGK